MKKVQRSGDCGVCIRETEETVINAEGCESFHGSHSITAFDGFLVFDKSNLNTISELRRVAVT